MLRGTQKQLLCLARNLDVVTRCLTAQKQAKKKCETVVNSQTALDDESFAINNIIRPHYLARILGAKYRQWTRALEKHPKLKTLKEKDIITTVESLKSINYEIDEILTKPMIIYNNWMTVLNRYNVLRECGLETINISTLSKYVVVMNKKVTLLKAHSYIPSETDVVNRLKSCFTDIELIVPDDKSKIHEEMELKAIRQILLNEYLRQRLGVDDMELTKMWKSYSRVRHKSFRSVQEMIELLLNNLKFSKERIKKNIFLLHGDPKNVRRMLTEIPSINKQDICEIVYKRPKILMTSCDSLKRTLEYVKSYGIHEDAILRCLEVLTLGPETVLERLRDMNEIKEFQVLGTNPRVLRLVHYQNKARLRLDYLNQLKVRCASLHILSCGSEAFAKFARDGSDRTKGRDVVVYLSNVLKKDDILLRNLLSRHPNWCHIPVTQIKQCFDFLSSKKFQNEDIFNSIHLLLYPIKRIQEKLAQLHTSSSFDDLQLTVNNVYELRNDQILTLVLYLIECEFHFTGDGIWTEQQTHHVENFNNLLPDFPESLNKVYKFGVQPSSRKLAMQP